MFVRGSEEGHAPCTWRHSLETLTEPQVKHAAILGDDPGMQHPALLLCSHAAGISRPDY